MAEKMFVHKDRESIINILLIAVICTFLITTCDCGTLQCYMGNRPDSTAALTVITCNSSSSHPLHAVTANSGDVAAVDGKDVKYCIIFTHGDGGGPSTSDFWCDYEHVCNATGLTTQVATSSASPDTAYRGKAGNLFCCSGSLCNSEQTAAATSSLQSRAAAAPSPVSCFVGNTTANVTKGHTQLCDASHTYCMRKQDKTTNMIKYSCDTKNECGTNAAESCQDASTLEFCCCGKSDCNKPNNLAALNYIPTHPMSPMPPRSESRAKITATYAVGAAVMILLLVLLGIIVVVGLRKCKQRQDAQYAYVYSELTADLAEESDKDDDTLLVP